MYVIAYYDMNEFYLGVSFMYYNNGFNQGEAIGSEFLFYQGVVTSITNFGNDGCSKIFKVTMQDRNVINFVINPDTYFINRTKVAVGMRITVYYDGNAPTVMIYPPQFNAVVAAVNNQIRNIKVDRFNGDLVSQDNTLKLNIGRNTEIVLENGQKFDGSLGGRNLIVLYGATTRSIPAQTTPEKIIVMCMSR